MRFTFNIILSVFNAGFVEASSDQFTFEITGDANLDNVDATSEYTALCAHPEDSDEEDEAYDPGEADGDPPNSDVEREDVLDVPQDPLEPGISIAMEELAGGDNIGGGEDDKARNVRQKVAHPSSPRGGDAQVLPLGTTPTAGREVPGPQKLRVVVKDVAYVTYRAVLYYVYPSPLVPVCTPEDRFQLYTDRIRFAPLSSSFLSTHSPGNSCLETANGSQASLVSATRAGPAELHGGASSRRQWTQEWMRGNPGQPLPCSAKAVYRLADSQQCLLRC
jgi:hypothetical protein